MTSREKILAIRLSEQEFEILKTYAESKGWNMSQVVRDFIRQYCGH